MPNTSDDFFDASQRHWDDAQSLYVAQRWANADHLYGLGVWAAEVHQL